MTWQGIVDDCTRVRGRRVGMAWEQTLAWTLMAIMGIWGAGTLLSFAVNRQQIVSVAEQAHALVEHPAVSDEQLTALHTLRNHAGRLQHRIQEGAPWYQRFGLDHNPQLLEALLPWYGVANNRLIRDPASAALTKKLNALANSEPNSDRRAQLATQGYDQLKAWLMMARPDKADGAYYAQTMKAVQPTRKGISTGLWQSLAPDLWAFYINELPGQPQWKITPDAQLVSQSRQVLLQQIGRRNAESTLYENMLTSVRRNFADVSLEDMTSGTDARRLFTTDEVVPGMFTRQAWEGGIQQAIEKAANSRRDEIDWVLSDSRKAVSSDLSPEALQARLTQRYFTDFAGSWLSFLNSLRLNPANNIADVTDQLTLMSDVRQSPLIALMNTIAWQGQTGQHSESLSDSIIKSAKDLVSGQDKPAIDQSASGPQGPLDDTFGPLLQLLGKNKGSNVMSADTSLSLQTYLTRITRVRLRLQQVASASDPQAMMQTLAQTVFQGKSVDLTDTQQYGSLISASLGEEWSGFGSTMFVQPLTQAWETVLQPSAASLNDKWSRSVVANWQTAFDGRFPFAASKSDASLPMLAEFVRKDSGRIERFLTTELNGVLHKEGSQWVPDKVNSQGLSFNPALLRAINQLSQLSDILFTDGSQGISFELQARPVPQVTPRLEADLHRINFYRLCQLLEKRNPGRPLMGSTSHPADDPVRFAPHPGMGFPASEIKTVEYDEEDDSKPPLIRTTFMGMYGVDSPLPTAYLNDITQRREGHEALQGFLDIFSHRILTQFYRIWRKYSYPATFEPGGTDTISQSLLGLVGLGIPGTAEHIATPVSRFLSLLGVLQQPGKTQEGMQALVSLLAPDTTVQVSPYCLRPVKVSQPLGFYGDDDFLLDGNTPLGEEAIDANSQLLIALFTDNEQESQGWKPDGLLYQDFLVMLRVYLGWRFKAKITLTTRTRLLVAPPLGEGPFWLGMNGVLGAQDEDLPEDIPQTFTTELGYYAGLEPESSQQGNRRVTYKFD